VMMDTEEESAPPLDPVDDLEDLLDDFDAYLHLKTMSDDDWDDLEAIRFIFSQNKKKRAAKFMYEWKEWKDWYGHADQLIQAHGFINRFRIPKDHFESLLDAIRYAITVDFMGSVQSTKGNDPVYSEVILAMGLRFVGLGSRVPDLDDLYGMSISSARCVINMFLDVVDHSTEFAPLQVKLPDLNDHNALHDLAQRWSEVSTAFGLFNNDLGAIDG